ncbi:MAG: RnfABCDGE type electron transport complex subunit D [Proteobacteria bacterium]|jgi:Na+-translocating ferredoxin:NAD+ oxidoreductase subunit D|nr:RnfABCDGE type electron transport complex subunit D [Pseudomonadota bacterium]MDA1301211.1 RnfABCDGE type electron transport complex subunit D [Pseudomonadota bacterium]
MAIARPIRKVSGLMLGCLLAMIPGALTMTWYFGPGILLNLITAITAALCFEYVALRLRRQRANALLDGSAVITGALIGLTLSPLLPLGLVVVGTGFAILIAKHAYGGMGNNLFNPAMVGYAVLIVSFPMAMARWPSPEMLPDLSILLAIKTGMTVPDGFTMATPLDQFRFRGAMTTDEYWTISTSARWQPWLAINMAFLAGGVYLLTSRICRWHGPVSMIATLSLLSILFYDSGSSDSLGSPLLHLFSGATMLGAFFILTDPVTSPESPRGELLVGVGVGMLTFIIRSWGAYPEGFAFAVLLMNAATPLINYLDYRR